MTIIDFPSKPGNSPELKPGRRTLLLVDDEPINLIVMAKILGDKYNTLAAQSGEEAWAMLEASPEGFDAVLLDRIMGDLGGDEVLERIRQHPKMEQLPVIFQSIRASGRDIRQGLELGANYYVPKPYDEDRLLGTVHSAVSRYINWRKSRHLMDATAHTLRSLSTMREGHMRFEFGTLLEAKRLAYLLANVCPDPERAVMGLIELNINAVEHGIADISFEEKAQLLRDGSLSQVCQQRLAAAPERRATIQVNVLDAAPAKLVEFVIDDPGSGFDHTRFENLDVEQLLDTHGRGIAISRLMAFDELFYNDTGNRVTARIHATS